MSQVRHTNPVTQQGYVQIPNAVVLRKDLSVGARLVYGYLKHLAWKNGDGPVAPARKVVGDDLGLSEKAVTGYLKELGEAKSDPEDPSTPPLVEVERRGQGNTNLYFLHDPQIGVSRKVESTLLEGSNLPFPHSLLKEEKSYKESLPKQPSPRGEVGAIYTHWREVCGKTSGWYDKISPNRESKIRARLKEFSAIELCRALDGVARDPWEERPDNNDLTIVFRSREQVEKFLELAEKPAGWNGNGNGPKCAWKGSVIGLTAPQLRECSCPRCLDFAGGLEKRGEVRVR